MPGRSALLRAYLAATALAAPLARRHLARRLAAGREDPARWREKLGQPSLPRPEGPLVWMHAVGVGEVLALPGLAARMRALRPGLEVLVTSSSRSSAEAVVPNLPQGARHQFLPLDCPAFVRPFLDHWRPDLSVWAERDVWPTLILASEARGIPMAFVNGKISAPSHRRKLRARAVFADLFARFAFVAVQDAGSARHLADFGVRAEVTGSMKAAAPPLADQPERRAALLRELAGRRVWVAASTHAEDEPLVAAAQALVLADDPGAALVVAPRVPARAEAALGHLRAAGLDAAVLGPDNALGGRHQAYVVPQIGQLGLWYRIADAAFVGGSMGPVGGHNPYEAARLDCAVLHGPNTSSLADDYAAFHAADAAREVATPEALAAALADPGLGALRARAAAIAQRGEASMAEVAARLVALMP